MIIDIALGIVLAVMILRFWPVIVAAGVLSIFAFVMIAIIASVVYAISLHEALVEKITILAILTFGFLVVTFVAHLIAQRTVLTQSEVGILLVITVMLLSASIVFLFMVTKWAEQANDYSVYLYLLPILGLWIWVWKKLLSMVRSRKILTTSETYPLD